MPALWFYRPHGIVGRVVSRVLRGDWVHVGIQHAVADVTVLTEAHPIKGVYCIPISRAVDPDYKVVCNIPDHWTANWLAQRWGVRYSWLDALAFASPRPVHRDLNPRQVVCSGLVVEYIRDANKAGYRDITLDLPTSIPADRVDPDMLFKAVRTVPVPV